MPVCIYVYVSVKPQLELRLTAWKPSWAQRPQRHGSDTVHMYMRRCLHGPLRSEKWGKKNMSHWYLILSRKLIIQIHLYDIYNICLYIYVSIQKERDGGGLDDQLPFGRGVYLSLLESIQDAVRMAELITDGTVIGQLCPQRRGWKGSHNFNSSKHLLVDHHYLLALGNGTVMKTVWNFPMAGENDDPPIWEWIVFPSYQNIKWVFPIFSYYPLE